MTAIDGGRYNPHERTGAGPMICIRTTLTSDTPHLPELAPLVGRRVRITVEEEPAPPPPGVPAPTPEQLARRHAAADRLSRSTYNWNVLAEQDAVDLADQQGRPHDPG